MSADHRDGAGEKRIGSFKADHFRNADTDCVLENGDYSAGEPVYNQKHAALFQQGKACTKSYRGKESQHERILECVGKVKSKASGGMSNPCNKHKKESADYRSRDTIPVKDCKFVLDKIADNQKDSGHRQRHNSIGVNVENIFNSFKRHSTYLQF